MKLVLKSVGITSRNYLLSNNWHKRYRGVTSSHNSCHKFLNTPSLLDWAMWNLPKWNEGRRRSKMRKLTKTQRLTTCTARKPTLASHTFQNLKAFEKSTMLWYTPRRDYGSQKEESLSEGPTGERVQEGNKILIGALYSAQTSYQPSCPDQFVRPILQDTTICLFWT